MRKKKYDLSTPAGRAMKLLDDPKWSWNKFPRKQTNYIRFHIHKIRDFLGFCKCKRHGFFPSQDLHGL